MKSHPTIKISLPHNTPAQDFQEYEEEEDERTSQVKKLAPKKRIRYSSGESSRKGKVSSLNKGAT